MALYLYATGAQRQTISVLSTLGLSESCTNLITKNERCECKKTTAKTTEPTTPDPNQATPMTTVFSSSQTNVMVSRSTELAEKYGSRYTGSTYHSPTYSYQTPGVQ